jgi:hypothetical protein
MGQNKTGNYPTKVTFMNGSLTMSGQPRWPDPDINISLPAAKSAQFIRLEYDGHLRLYGWSDDTWTTTPYLYDVMKFVKPVGIGDHDHPTFCSEYGDAHGAMRLST